MSSRAVSPVFAGREAELTVLASAFGDAARGLPGLVLVGGCVELSAAGLPYAPFTAALRQLVRQRGAAEVSALLGGRDTGELAGLLPEFGRPPGDADPDLARARLFELLLALLEVLA